MAEPVRDLLDFIDVSPTPYHVVADALRRLESAGWVEASEREVWALSPGDRRYVVRNGGSLVAFDVGTEAPSEAGFRIVGAHTDSPNLRLRPRADMASHGYRQFGVETYGGLLLHTWLDRDLSIAGRVTLEGDGAPKTLLLDFARPLVRVANLAIHLNRELRTDGLKLNAQSHSIPIAGLEDAPPLASLIAKELHAQSIAEVESDAILAFDLMLYDTQPSCVSGIEGEFIFAPRLDNLASCHAGLSALTGVEGAAEFTRVLVLYDHEEVGSRSAQGAAGTFLLETLERTELAFKGGAPQGLSRARSRSVLVSADMAHAVHPNYADKHEAEHRPVLGRGPVIKSNQDQAYATDAVTSGLFASLCADVDVEPQQFQTRNDIPCGSTIGPITAARVGIPTVDVGNPMLSMHSVREMAGARDVEPMIRVLSRFYRG